MEKNKKEYINKRTKKIAVILSLLGLSFISVESVKRQLEIQYRDDILNNSEQINSLLEDITFEEPVEEKEYDIKPKIVPEPLVPTTEDELIPENKKPEVTYDGVDPRQEMPAEYYDYETKPDPDYDKKTSNYKDDFYDKDIRKIDDVMDEDKDDKTKPYPEEDVTPSVTKSKTIKKKIQ